jgi:hypothetical protein
MDGIKRHLGVSFGLGGRVVNADEVELDAVDHDWRNCAKILYIVGHVADF